MMECVEMAEAIKICGYAAMFFAVALMIKWM